MKVCSVTLPQVLAVRQAVLWPNKSTSFCSLQGDEGALHLGVLEGGAVLSVMTVFIDGDTAQFRKFATQTAYQSKGVGSLLFEQMIVRIRAQGCRSVWCDARVSALGFYLKRGMHIHDDIFDRHGIQYQKLMMNL